MVLGPNLYFFVFYDIYVLILLVFVTLNLLLGTSGSHLKPCRDNSWLLGAPPDGDPPEAWTPLTVSPMNLLQLRWRRGLRDCFFQDDVLNSGLGEVLTVCKKRIYNAQVKLGLKVDQMGTKQEFEDVFLFVCNVFSIFCKLGV